MVTLATRLLLLVPLGRTMVATRVERDDFSLDCELPDGVASVHFGPEWPGEAAEHYPDFLRYLGDAAYVDGTFVVVERATLEAVGQIGTSGTADDDGAVEIGYGINASRRRSGFATEAVVAVAAHLLDRPGIARVTARTEVGNLASRRVLEVSGFHETAPARAEGDGFVHWARERG